MSALLRSDQVEPPSAERKIPPTSPPIRTMLGSPGLTPTENMFPPPPGPMFFHWIVSAPRAGMPKRTRATPAPIASSRRMLRVRMRILLGRRPPGRHVCSGVDYDELSLSDRRWDPAGPQAMWRWSPYTLEFVRVNR